MCGVTSISPTSGKSGSLFVADSGCVPDSEAASVAVPKLEGSPDGDRAAEAEVRLLSWGNAGVGDAAAAFAGGSEAVGAAEADGKQPAEAEAEAKVKAVVGAAVEAV